MNKTLLIDGQNILKVAFHGNKNTYTDFGYIGALITFYQMIRNVVKDYQIDKVIIFWDGYLSGKLRYDIYPEYKSNRGKNWNTGEIILSEKDIKREEDSDKSLLKQRERIKQYAEELFFRQYEDDYCEADDCIAYYSMHLKQDNELCIIMSNDGDFAMLVNDSVYQYRPKDKSIINPNNFWLYYHFDRRNSALIKAVEGCDSDIVYGVEGVGEKTLLKYFPELRTEEVDFDFIYNKAIEINSKRKEPLKALQNLIDGKTKSKIVNANIINGKHLYEQNLQLVNLKIPFMTDECIENLESATLAPMSPEDRGGKNLLRLMHEDGFIKSIPGGDSAYPDFLTPFVPTVKKEKFLYQKYIKENP